MKKSKGKGVKVKVIHSENKKQVVAEWMAGERRGIEENETAVDHTVVVVHELGQQTAQLLEKLIKLLTMRQPVGMQQMLLQKMMMEQFAPQLLQQLLKPEVLKQLLSGLSEKQLPAKQPLVRPQVRGKRKIRRKH